MLLRTRKHALYSKRYTFGIIWIAVLCLFDAVATDVGMRLQLIAELNPFAKWLYDTHVAVFYTYKTGLPLALLAIVPYIKRQAFISVLLTFAVVVYSLLALYHLGWLGYAMMNG